jgi:hypothetical protein
MVGPKNGIGNGFSPGPVPRAVATFEPDGMTVGLAVRKTPYKLPKGRTGIESCAVAPGLEVLGGLHRSFIKRPRVPSKWQLEPTSAGR